MPNRAGWINDWPQEYRPVLERLAQICGFTELRCLREISGGSGARTYLVAPEGGHGRAGLIVLKIGPASVLGADKRGNDLAWQHFSGALYETKRAEAGPISCFAMLLAGEGNAIPFNEFYRTASSKHVANALTKLFGETLPRDNLTAKMVNRSVFGLHILDSHEQISRELRRAGDGLPTLAFLVETRDARMQHAKRHDSLPRRSSCRQHSYG